MSVTMDRPVSHTSNGMGLTEDNQHLADAKAYLQQTSTETGVNLYDHLSSLLTRVLQERPCNPADMLEDLSKEEKTRKFPPINDSIINKVDPSREVALAEQEQTLFTRRGDDDSTEDDDDSPLPNLMEKTFYFEQAGIGLSREEMVRIWLAMKTLAQSHSFASIRFWGKVFGLEQNYVVAEVVFVEGEEDDDEDDQIEDGGDSGKILRESAGSDDNDDNELLDEPPKVVYKPPPVVEKEEKGTGVNKMTYFVCNEPGQPWTKLPSVTPAQINVARKIKKFFMGKLDAPIITFPPFPGNESNYLRAQIARISAGTQASPIGFYQLDEEEEEPEEGDIRESYLENEEYDPLTVRELISPQLENWVHHTLHILPQGRVRWWNPSEANDDDELEDDDSEAREEPIQVEPEVGPPLLTPLSEDAELNGLPAWTTRISSKRVPKYAVAVIHSCLWPGAHAFAVGRTFDNVYIGWGHKYVSESFNPAVPAPPQMEFPGGPETTEVDDPTPEEETAFKLQQAASDGDDDDDDNDDMDDGEDD